MKIRGGLWPRTIEDEDGRIWAIPAGGAGDDLPPSSNDDDGDDDDDGGNADGDDDTDDDEDDDGEREKGKAAGEAVTREEFERVMKRMKAADRRASEAEKKVKEYQDAEKDELTRVQDDLSEVTAERDTLQSTVQNLSLRLAVLTNKNASNFHDSEDVLRFVDLSDLTDEDGEIDNKKVDSALKDLAERKPHLVKSEPEAGDDDDDDEGDDDKNKARRSGSAMNGDRNKKKTQGLDRATLAAKYPALRR